MPISLLRLAPYPKLPYLKVINGETYGFLANGQKIFGQYAINGHWYLLIKPLVLCKQAFKTLALMGKIKPFTMEQMVKCSTGNR